MASRDGQEALAVQATKEGVLLTCRVSPRAGRTAIKGIRDGMLLVALASPPVEGKANEALIRHLAAILHVAPSRIEILRGERTRIKRLLVRGLSAEELLQRLF